MCLSVLGAYPLLHLNTGDGGWGSRILGEEHRVAALCSCGDVKKILCTLSTVNEKQLGIAQSVDKIETGVMSKKSKPVFRC